MRHEQIVIRVMKNEDEYQDIVAFVDETERDRFEIELQETLTFTPEDLWTDAVVSMWAHKISGTISDLEFTNHLGFRINLTFLNQKVA